MARLRARLDAKAAMELRPAIRVADPDRALRVQSGGQGAARRRRQTPHPADREGGRDPRVPAPDGRAGRCRAQELLTRGVGLQSGRHDAHAGDPYLPAAAKDRGRSGECLSADHRGWGVPAGGGVRPGTDRQLPPHGSDRLPERSSGTFLGYHWSYRRVGMPIRPAARRPGHDARPAMEG